MNLPTGTVTFLFTDVENSIRLWEQDPEGMHSALAWHDTLLRNIIEANNGVVFKTVGSAFCAAFAMAPNAVSAALEAQVALLQSRHSGHKEQEAKTPIRADTYNIAPSESPASLATRTSASSAAHLRVKMAIHTGGADERDGDYFGSTLNRVARMLATGHGGQILISNSTANLVQDHLPPGAGLQDLGEVRLPDLERAQRVFQLQHADLPATLPPLRSLDTYPNNLPQQLTSFIGREKEITEIKQRLTEAHLLTLAGPGGSGKTRLGLQVAAELTERYTDGVWLADLAPVADPSLVLQTVAQALGVREEPGRSLIQTLSDFLKSKRLLLLLDNCEHLLGACARAIDTLLHACPDIQILATSRETIGISCEIVYRVPSLSLPEPDHVPTTDNLIKYEAIRLFADRATSVDTEFELTDQNGAFVAQICQHLDGIPLAIELAAARIRALPVQQIAARLDDRFRLLTKGSRTAMPRQQTLRALIDWSYDLLKEQERLLFHKLSVFAGGWTLEAAEAIAGGEDLEEWEILDALTSLVDKSLVVAEEHAGHTRYRLLETVRQYSRERLEASGANRRVSARHRDYFLMLAEEAAPKLRGPEQVAWYERVETEHDNLRAALGWCQTDEEGVQKGLRLVEALKLFWCIRGYFSEGQDWVKRTLERGVNAAPASRARVLNTGGVLAWFQADYGRLQTMCEEALALAQTAHDRWSIGASLILLGSGASLQGDFERATQLLDQSRPIALEEGDPWLIAQSLHHSGFNALNQGNMEQAAKFAEAALDVARKAGDKWVMALATRVLGSVALQRRDYSDAEELWREAVRLYQQLRYKWGLATCMEGLARVSSIGGHSEIAARMYGAAAAIREATGAPLPPNMRRDYEQDIASVRAKLGDEAFHSAWAAGRHLELEEAIEEALTTSNAT